MMKNPVMSVANAVFVAGVDVMADRMSATIYSCRTGAAPVPVASTQCPHPLVGTPARAGHAGNSTRPAASVRGLQKSERYGERDRTEVNVRAARHGGK